VTSADLADALEKWYPPVVETVGQLTSGQVEAMSDALGLALDTGPDASWVPLFWHELAFGDWFPIDSLGEDGHPERGPLYPPIVKRRRMFGGGHYREKAPLTLDMPIVRRSSVISRALKDGQSGPLLIVQVLNTYLQHDRTLVWDRHDLAYRSGHSPPAPTRAGGTPLLTSDEATSHSFQPTEVLLQRFSAYTGNSHRIHFDLPYAHGIEGYPALVVHGPLLAIVMAEQGANAMRPTTMDYRFHAPAYVGGRLTVRTAAGREPGRRLVEIQCAERGVLASATLSS
jgi:3-methylfumaryl-CoA hydratase